MDFIDRSLEKAPFSSRHILNFLHNGAAEDRPADMPDFDWRDIFNLTDRVIGMLNQYGEVSLAVSASPLWCRSELAGRPAACVTVELEWQQKRRSTCPH